MTGGERDQSFGGETRCMDLFFFELFMALWWLAPLFAEFPGMASIVGRLSPSPIRPQPSAVR